MAFRKLCSACEDGRCEQHVAQSGHAGVLGGTFCPCMHTEEEKRENIQRKQRWIRAMFGGSDD